MKAVKLVTYCIDTENIGAPQWVRLLDSMSVQDRLLLFVSDQSGKAYASLKLESMHKFLTCASVVRVATGTKNALDFQLVAEVGALSAQDPRRQYAIVSNDHGFDAAVANMVNRGIDAVRLDSTDIAQICKDSVKLSSGKNASVTRDDISSVLIAGGCPQTSAPIVADCIISCRKLPASEKKQALHDRLQKIFTSSVVNDLYRNVRPVMYEALKSA